MTPSMTGKCQHCIRVYTHFFGAAKFEPSSSQSFVAAIYWRTSLGTSERQGIEYMANQYTHYREVHTYENEKSELCEVG